MSRVRSGVWVMLLGCSVGLGAARPALAENPMPEPVAPPSASVLDPTQTYEIFFSLHAQEIDRLSNVRLLGTQQVGQKTFLKFQTLLNNSREEGLIDLQTVSAIFPSPKPLVVTSEIVLERQPLNKEKIEEVRSETVREIFRQGQPPPMPAQHD